MQLNYFTAGLATLILASTSALAAPSPAPPAVVEPANFFKNAEAHGVDPYGPMPDDFTSFENGVYAFDAGSKFEMWVQAQLDLDPKEASVKKRQTYAFVGIGMWLNTGCSGGGVYANPVLYGNSYVNNGSAFRSWGIDTRALQSNEHLDFSSGTWCSSYQFSAPSMAGQGCRQAAVSINCFKLWT